MPKQLTYAEIVYIKLREGSLIWVEDLEIYLKKFKEEIPKLMPEIKQMTICRASKDSLLHLVTYDSEEKQNLATERFLKWRGSITEEF